MAGTLEAAQRADLYQVAQVQTRCGGVEPAVQRERACVAVAMKRIEVSTVRDQAAPGQLINNVHSHPRIIPHAPRRTPGAAGRSIPPGCHPPRTAKAGPAP